MNTGRLVFAGLFALILAIGASSTAQAGSSYGFSISTGGPAWIAPPPVYIAPPPPIMIPVAPLPPPPPPPVICPAPLAMPVPFAPSVSFGFVSH